MSTKTAVFNVKKTSVKVLDLIPGASLNSLTVYIAPPIFNCFTLQYYVFVKVICIMCNI